MPEYCYALSNTTGELIRIMRGESGYYEVKDKGGESIMGDQAEGMMNSMNSMLGVTPEQREAMVLGSMFGWDVPAASPNHPMAQMSGK